MILLHGSGVNGNWMLQSLPFKEFADKHQVRISRQDPTPLHPSHCSSDKCVEADSLRLEADRFLCRALLHARLQCSCGLAVGAVPDLANSSASLLQHLAASMSSTYA